jgi:hypothetical protein
VRLGLCEDWASARAGLYEESGSETGLMMTEGLQTLDSCQA